MDRKPAVRSERRTQELPHWLAMMDSAIGPAPVLAAHDARRVPVAGLVIDVTRGKPDFDRKEAHLTRQ